jgi:hypothetical protein
VGERVESAGIAVTVQAVSRTPSLGTLFKAKSGNTYVVLDTTIENTGRDVAPYNPLYFKLKDGAGFEYNSALGGEQSLKSGELKQGELARGQVAFEVPAGASGLSVSYQPVVIFGGYQVIRIGLD